MVKFNQSLKNSLKNTGTKVSKKCTNNFIRVCPGWTVSLQRVILPLRPIDRALEQSVNPRTQQQPLPRCTLEHRDGGGPITWPPQLTGLDVSRFLATQLRKGQSALFPLHRHGNFTASTAALPTQIALTMLNETLQGLAFRV
jgi:hypothetical protein